MFRDLFTPGVYSAPGSRNQYYKFQFEVKTSKTFFFSWSAFSCKKNQFSPWPVHTRGPVSKFKQILQWSLLKYFQKMVATGISVSVCSICNCHAGRYYKIHEMVGFYTFNVENKCSNWHSGATAPPPPLQGPNLVEPAESGLGLICIVVLVSLFFNTHETGQERSQ